MIAAASAARMGRSRFRVAGPLALLGAVAVASVACVTPLEGPRLTRPPRGFGMTASALTTETGFGGRRIETLRTYARLPSPRSFITIAEHAGDATREDVDQEHLAALRLRGGEDVLIGEVEETRIDGRPAWEWMESTPDRRTFVAVVSYPDATFVIRFDTSEAEFRDEAVLRRTVHGFARDLGTESALIVLGVVGAVALAGFLGWRFGHARPARGT